MKKTYSKAARSSTPAAIVAIPFHGDQLHAVDSDAGPRVILKRVCESLGIDPWTQQKKLQKTSWATTGFMPVVAQNGKKYKTFCVDTRTLLMWLATIEASRVSPRSRPLLERYQSEVADVLEAHFRGRVTRASEEDLGLAASELAAENQALRLENERLRSAAVTREQSRYVRGCLKEYASRVADAEEKTYRSVRMFMENEVRRAASWERGGGRSLALLPACQWLEIAACLERLKGRAREADRALASRRKASFEERQICLFTVDQLGAGLVLR